MDKYIKEMFNDVRKFCGDLKNALVAATEDTGWIRLNANVVYRRKNGVVYVNHTATVTSNSSIIPYQIYGIKLGGS